MPPTAASTDGVHLYPANSTDRRVTLQVIGRRDGRTLLNVTGIVVLHRHHLVTGPCGNISEVDARAVITAAGAIDAH